jgi:hypothetical protein
MDKLGMSYSREQSGHTGQFFLFRLEGKMAVAHIGLTFSSECIDQMLFCDLVHS